MRRSETRGFGARAVRILMFKREPSRWWVVAVLFVELFFIFGAGYLTTGVFFPPLVKEFGWSRTRVSLLASVFSLMQGLIAPLVGWLLDRLQARLVMTAGAFLAGCGMVIAGDANSFGVLLVAYSVLGIGLSASTLIPASLVIARRFSTERGLAMGIAMAGTTVGAMTMTMVASYLISAAGWRTAYLVMGAPILALIAPMIFFGVRNASGSRPSVSNPVPSGDLPDGLEMTDAIRARSFWALICIEFCFSLVAGGVVFHLVIYLIGIGFKADAAAGILSVMFGFNALGKFTMGWVADRVSGRVALTAGYLAAAVGLLLLIEAGHYGALVLFILTFGPTFAAELVLVPMITVDSLGMRRYGSISGWLGLSATIGVAIGPLVSGRSFDLFKSYTPAFMFYVVVCLIGSASAYSCLPLKVEAARARARRTRVAKV